MSATLNTREVAVALDALYLAHDYYSTKPFDDEEGMSVTDKRAMLDKAIRAANLYRKLGGTHELRTPEKPPR